MLSEQGESKGDGRGGGRQIYTQRDVAASYKSPVQCGTDIYHSLTPHSLVIVNAGGCAAQVQESLRVTPAKLVELASLGKFFVRVDLDGLEQSIGDSMASYIGGDHRLGNEVREAIQKRLFVQF